MGAEQALVTRTRPLSTTTRLRKSDRPPGRSSRRAPPWVACIVLMSSSQNGVVEKEFPEFFEALRLPFGQVTGHCRIHNHPELWVIENLKRSCVSNVSVVWAIIEDQECDQRRNILRIVLASELGDWDSSFWSCIFKFLGQTIALRR